MKDVNIRVAKEFDKALDTIATNRVRNGKDNDKRSDTFLTGKLIKHPLFPKIKEDLEVFTLKDE